MNERKKRKKMDPTVKKIQKSNFEAHIKYYPISYDYKSRITVNLVLMLPVYMLFALSFSVHDGI
jgi:hypothetical protein